MAYKQPEPIKGIEIKLRLEAKDRQGVLHDPEAGEQHDRESQQAQRLVRGGVMVRLCLASHFVFSKILLYSSFVFFLVSVSLTFSFLLHLF